MLHGLYGGSFDPPHLGHLSIIERAATLFDAVSVVAVANPHKTGGMFSRAERANLLRSATAHLPTVHVYEYHGLIVDVARELRADVLLRAAHKERRDEQSMAATNVLLSGIETSMMAADPTTAWISSSAVRQLAQAGHEDTVRSMVPPCVWEALNERLFRS